MADEWIKVGMTFTVTLDIRLPDGTALLTLTDYTGHRIYYKRPDGKTSYIAVDTVTATTLKGTVDTTLNPISASNVPPRWANGYPGSWEFYPYVPGSGSIVFRGKEDIVIVHPEWRNPN